MKEFIEKLIDRFEEMRMNYFLTIANTGSEKLDTAYGYTSDAVNKTIEIVNELAEEYNNGWISCKERLPKSNGWYLVTNVLGVVQQQYWGASHWQKLRDEAVIAWMPLPQPYTEEQKELSTTWQQQTMNRFERVE